MRAPSIAPGVKAFLWALFFALFLWIGMKGIGVSDVTAFVVGAVAGFLIFLWIRVASPG